jgi:SAM-dependent methyltransferase
MPSHKTGSIQSVEELEKFYSKADPWDYDDTLDDAERKARLLALLPQQTFSRTLDIGCGNGFVTVELPGEEVVGVDISANAIRFARERADLRPDASRFSFQAASIFELADFSDPGAFDLIVLTGVIYGQYIGNAFASVRLIIDRLLEPGGYLVSCHIDEWSPWRFPYTIVDLSYYPYREFHHRLEVFQK